jgi:hypothetical protein
MCAECLRDLTIRRRRGGAHLIDSGNVSARRKELPPGGVTVAGLLAVLAGPHEEVHLGGCAADRQVARDIGLGGVERTILAADADSEMWRRAVAVSPIEGRMVGPSVDDGVS